jgi:hypothetical protein
VLLALGVLLVALALGLAWLGRGMRALPAAAARQDVGWLGGAVLDPERASAAQRAAAALDERHRHSSFPRVVGVFRAATIAPRNQLRPRLQPNDGKAEIERLLPGVHDPQERAQAEVMIGILLAAAAGNGSGTLDRGQGTGGNLLLGQAADHFRAAVADDPANEDAKVDLELLLQSSARTPKPHNGDKGKQDGKKSQLSQPKIRNAKRANVPQASLTHPGTGY